MMFLSLFSVEKVKLILIDRKKTFSFPPGHVCPSTVLIAGQTKERFYPNQATQMNITHLF